MQLMLFARACTLAARFAEPGATMGLYSYDEMADIHNVSIDSKYVEEVM